MFLRWEKLRKNCRSPRAFSQLEGRASAHPTVKKNKTTTTIFEPNLRQALLNIGQVSVLVKWGLQARGTLSYSSLKHRSLD